MHAVGDGEAALIGRSLENIGRTEKRKGDVFLEESAIDAMA